MKEYLTEHPFIVVGVVTLVFMSFILKEDLRSVKHNKHMKEIEEKKRKKKLLHENKTKTPVS